MYVSFKFRLYPFKDQERELNRQLGELNFLWNYALEQRIETWRLEHKSITFVDQCRSLTRWRRFDRDGIERVNAQVAQDCLARLNDAFLAFFSRRSSYPHFKRETTSMTYPQACESVRFTDGRNRTKRLRISKVGDIPIEVHRAPPEGCVKTCTVEREGDRWYAVLTFEVPVSAPPPTTPPEKPLGVDLGLTHLAVTSEGETVEPPKFLQRTEHRLKRAQRVMSRRKKGSHNREKAKRRVARLHAKVRDQRRDFAHQLTTGWAEEHDLIAFEGMDLREHMLGRFSKATADAGWGMLRQMSEYKQRNRSHRYIEVPTKGTTQTCSGCARLHDPLLTLKDRTYDCPCGLRLDRDLNAAKNVVARALVIVGRGTPKSMPVEIGPPPIRKGRRVLSRNQEPPPSESVIA